MKQKLILVILLAISTHSYGGGTNTGGGLGNASDLVNWCRGLTGKLKYYLDESDIQLLNFGSEAAFITLKNGMEKSLVLPSGTLAGNSLMHIALERGLAIALALKDPSMSHNISADAALAVIRQYYSFLMDEVSRADVDYYIPYFNCTHNCNYNEDREKQFEERFVTYSRAALSWLNNKFITPTAEKGPMPNHSPKLYLKLAEFMISNAVMDLTNPNSIWQNKYACVIENLKLLQANIIDHNLGNTSHYGNDRIAVIKIYGQIQSVSSEFYQINGKLSGQLNTSGGFCR